jgi:uncharacterized protein
MQNNKECCGGDSAIVIKDNTANPAPLGLLGFGMTTVLLNLHNAGFYPLDTMILSMGMFYGGLAQIIAGIMEWKKNNTFGTTAFLSYGLFWWSLVALLILPKLNLGMAPVPAAMASYLFIWGIFTLVLFFGTLKINRALQFVFATLTVLFILLAIGNGTGNSGILHIAGYEGIICGLTAVYAGFAQIINELYGRIILPICPIKK